MPAEFSSFHKRQLTFEARFDEAFILWDRAGAVWNSFHPIFKSMKAGTIRPDRQIFHADQRYILNISLDRFSITDFVPGASWEKSFETIAACFQNLTEVLEIKVLTRIGTRFQYSLETKSIEEARKRVSEYSWALSPGTLFQIEPKSATSSLKLEVDDGELGYIAQVYAEERRLEIDPSPDTIPLKAEKFVGRKSEVVIDIDFMTKGPTSIESFRAMPWLAGWQSALNRNANALLNLGKK